MRQKTWEVWMYISLFTFLSFFLVGTLPGSMDEFPNFLWGFIPSVINLAVCILYGLKESDN